MPSDNSILAREQEHFDRLYSVEAQECNVLLTQFDKKRYSNPSCETIYSREYFYHLVAPRPGKKVLEIACGNGFDSCLCAYYGAEVYAYDLSPMAINLSQRRAEENGVTEKVKFKVGGDLHDAFPEEQFDAIMGFATLHHLRLDGLGNSIHARLRPNGVAVFAEPVVNSRVLAELRKLIPYRFAEVTEDEHVLNDEAIAEIAKPFNRLERREFECVSRIYPLFKNHRQIVRALHYLDYWLMKIRPLRRFASVVVFALYKGQ